MSGGTLIVMKGIRELPKGTPRSVRSQMDTLLLTQAGVAAWKVPPFQRPLRVNNKVRALVEELKHNDGVLPGVLTIGVLDRERYIIDGQHRVEAYKLSELAEGFADVRICHFDSMGEMGQEFVDLNSSLVRLCPDDILRGLESSHKGLATIRRKCPFIGYDMIRRGPASPIVSMSAALRSWFISEPEVPASALTGGVHSIVERITDDEAARVVDFYEMLFLAWGKDPEYRRLWLSLNVTISAWMWRRLVLSQYSPSTIRLERKVFTKCLMGMSANGLYMDWLVGRMLNDRDRGPAYSRIREIFVARLKEELPGKNIRMPAPGWAHGGGSGSRKAIT